MNRVFTLLFILSVWANAATSQVKPGLLYNKRMPYGVLDIRTTVSKVNYYYLSEGKTFSFRESAPGVPTETYRDMTGWDSNPYEQGHLRHKTKTADEFVMNYRLLKPQGYRRYSRGYPMIVVMHGAVERGNCYYNSCYHSDWNYDPNENVPKAPTAVDHKLLNNDHHLITGGQAHLAARNLAGTKLPNNRTLSPRAFPGFVLYCQMTNEWNSTSVENMIRIVRLLTDQYKIDPNRIYIHGLSIGGFGVYEAVKRAPWMFAAALPMSANKNANIFSEKMEKRLIHIPFWIFQGGRDKEPTPAYTKSTVDKLTEAGASVRYTEYPTLSHVVWNAAYAEPDFFSFMLTKDLTNPHILNGTEIDRSKRLYPRLVLPSGFHAYQWQKNGVNLASKSYALTITTPGKYRVRFSRVPKPTAKQWNRWSKVIVIKEVKKTKKTSASDSLVVDSVLTVAPVMEVFPNPATPGNLTVRYSGEETFSIRIVDHIGREVFEQTYEGAQGPSDVAIPNAFPPGLYIVTLTDGEMEYKERLVIR